MTPFLFSSFREFKKKDTKKRLSMNISDLYPCLLDKTMKTGFDTHYVYHTSWAARKVKEIHPLRHVDISSSLYFCGIVSAFVPVDFYDYRPADLRLSNLTSSRTDLTKLHFKDTSIPSLSCMHTIEHIGLGRYGDPIDPEGDLKAIAELKRVLSVGGSLLFVTPVGKPKIAFNAHRIYSYDQIISYFNGFKLMEFSLVPDNCLEMGFIINASKELADKQDYGCGCFWFKKTA
jgi:hypothetical protein